jgi:hypothetical protein
MCVNIDGNYKFDLTNTLVFVCFLLGNFPASECYMPKVGNYPEESIQHSEQGESLKSRIYWCLLLT